MVSQMVSDSLRTICITPALAVRVRGSDPMRDLSNEKEKNPSVIWVEFGKLFL